jgi:hypothetical protein
MANRSVTKDVSDNIIAAAVLSSFWGDKIQLLVEAHASDKTKVTVNKGGYYIPLLIGDAFFLIDTATHVSSVDDIDTGAVAAGRDYNIYACNNSGTLVLKTSLASTFPSGYDATTSRKIGGFHTLCADVGTISGHTLTGYVNKEILPASIWDLKHRARCGNNAGMVFDSKSRIWVDIYLASGTGASTVSVNGGTISDTRTWLGFVDDGGAVGKRLLTDTEFQHIALGTIEEAHMWNYSDPVTTGGKSSYGLLTLHAAPAPAEWSAGATITGVTSTKTATVVAKITGTTYVIKNITVANFTAGENITDGTNLATGNAGFPTLAAYSGNPSGRKISNIGCEDCAGAMSQWLLTPAARLDDSTTAGWYDLPGVKGSFYTYGTNKYGNTQLFAGGVWDNASYAGSRCRSAYSYRWTASSTIGARFSSEPL